MVHTRVQGERGREVRPRELPHRTGAAVGYDPTI